ncbi:clasp N terminal-domain-containing protein [Syncephalis plumigaleata]|nr:clasp N terminal-domain-containing protein [Syncephalis plumigaleata]
MDTSELIYVTNNAQFEAEFSKIRTTMNQKESEENWHQMQQALQRLNALSLGGAYKMPGFIPGIKSIRDSFVNSINTERTQLSGTAVELVQTLARVLRKDFIQVFEILIPPLVRLCARTNKVFVKRAMSSLERSIQFSQLPEFLSPLAEAQQSASKGLRRCSVECLKMVIQKIPASEFNNNHVNIIETMIRAGLVDADADSRAEARKAYEVYAKSFEQRVPAFMETLEPRTQKMLGSSGAKPSSSKARPGASAAGRSNIRQHLMQRKKAAEQASNNNSNDIEIYIPQSSSVQQDNKDTTSSSSSANGDAKKPASSPRCEEKTPSVARRTSDDDEDDGNNGNGNGDNNATQYNGATHTGNANISNGNGTSTTSGGMTNNGVSSSTTSGAATDALPISMDKAAKGPSPPTSSSSSSSTSSQQSSKSETTTQSTNVVTSNINAKYANSYPNLGISKAVTTANTSTKRGLGVASRVTDGTQSTKRSLSHSLRSTTSPKTGNNTTATNKAAGAARIPLTARTRNGAVVKPTPRSRVLTGAKRVLRETVNINVNNHHNNNNNIRPTASKAKRIPSSTSSKKSTMSNAGLISAQKAMTTTTTTTNTTNTMIKPTRGRTLRKGIDKPSIATTMSLQAHKSSRLATLTRPTASSLARMRTPQRKPASKIPISKYGKSNIVTRSRSRSATRTMPATATNTDHTNHTAHATVA